MTDIASFVGVAPDAKLLAYKVDRGNGTADPIMVINAIVKAYIDRADIITISIGGLDPGEPSWVGHITANLVSRGVFVSISAGNNGMNGPFQLSPEAIDTSTLAVAASDPYEYPAYEFTANFHLRGRSDQKELAYTLRGFDPHSEEEPDPWPSTIFEWPIIPVTRNITTAKDACSPLAKSTANINGTIVLIRSGGCSFSTKLLNLEPFNPQYVLFYQDDSPLQLPPRALYRDTFKTAVIDKAAGESIIKTILDGGNVTASFDTDPSNYVGIYNSGGGLPGFLTSWGPTFDLTLKPDV